MECELADQVRLFKEEDEAEKAHFTQFAKNLSRSQTESSYTEGDARRALLDEVRELNPAAIAIAAHAHGAMHDMLFGAVRRSLVKNGDWPVLVVPTRTRKGSRRTGA